MFQASLILILCFITDASSFCTNLESWGGKLRITVTKKYGAVFTNTGTNCKTAFKEPSWYKDS